MPRPTRILPASPDAIAEAAACLIAGGLVAFPTETVYGLGADATSGEAVARLYRAKGRPSFNPLISHVPDLAAARALAVFDADAERLAEAFWPGPLTLVLPKTPGCPVSDLATAGLDTLAIRVPAHPLARDLLRAAGRPIAAPSANVSGRVSPTAATHVAEDLDGRIDIILDGGPVRVGVESTIVVTRPEPVLLRPGGLARRDIERVLRRPLRDEAPPADPDRPQAPGMLASHYAPRLPVRLEITQVSPGEALLAFGPHPVKGQDSAAMALNLSERGDTVEAAANLFGFLRQLDTANASAIAVMPIPNDGLGEAINDRLHRAAAPRG